MTVIKNKIILILSITIILILSMNVIAAEDTNTTQINNQQENAVSIDESNNITSNGAYLILDNDADKENIRLGDYVTWILKVQNLGPNIANNTKVYDELPAGLIYINHTATKGIYNPNTGIWDIGDLKIDDGIETLWITVKSITTGEKINKAYITSDTPNLNNESYEEEEIDVIARDYNNHVSANMHKTGNPLFLIFASVMLLLIIPLSKK